MKTRATWQSGFSLVEVTLALGIAAFCLVVIFGLLPLGLNSNRDASQETEACGILSSVISDLYACPSTVPAGMAAQTTQYGIPIPANPVSSTVATTLYFSAEGAGTTTLTPQAVYRLSVEFRSNGTNVKAPTMAFLKASWPAAAAVSKATGAVDLVVALDRN